jgi:adenine-specific DNA-methyltransferase
MALLDAKRQKGLLHRFDRLRTDIVCATPFASQPTLLRYLPESTWETEVWSANAPTHPVPFNGGRLLGQYTAEGKSRERAGLCNA